jgi:dynein heavy chain
VVFQEVQDVADKCKSKMDAATALISGLSGEQIRWTQQLASFKSDTNRLIGDVLILTGFLSYSGPFNQQYRRILEESWTSSLNTLKIPVTAEISIIANLVDTATVSNT